MDKFMKCGACAGLDLSATTELKRHIAILSEPDENMERYLKNLAFAKRYD
jgi:hypothetical protein